MYTVRWLLLLTLVKSVWCEFEDIGCYLSGPLQDEGADGAFINTRLTFNDCMTLCSSLFPHFGYDVALYQGQRCHCSGTFNPPEWEHIKESDCTPSNDIFNVGAGFVQDCSVNCAKCTANHDCIVCESGFELNDNYICESFSCSVTPRSIQHYPDLYRGSIIFVDFPFQCNGSVSAVEFYAERAGTFYFTAWRPSASGDSWTLLGYNVIVSEGDGAQTYTIPSDEQMVVLASDVFGFVYEKGVRYKIISSENISKRRRNGTSSRFVRTRETLDDLSIGVNRSNLAGEGDTERIVPINAIIS